jgi:hypothetical protein
MGTSMRADDTAALIAWPHANICSDGTLNGGHPRRSTVEDPRAPSVGIARVWVNGVVVLVDGHPTGAHPGQPLRRASSRPFTSASTR